MHTVHNVNLDDEKKIIGEANVIFEIRVVSSVI